jgi:hypothetical protein
MDGTGDHHVKQNKPDSERQIPHVFSNMWNLDLKKMTWMQKGDCLGRKPLREDRVGGRRGWYDHNIFYAHMKTAWWNPQKLQKT